MDSRKPIVKKISIYELETSDNGTISLPSIHVEREIMQDMDEHLKKKVLKEQLEVVLVNMTDGSASNVWFSRKKKEYVFKNFFQVIENYEIKNGDSIELLPEKEFINDKMILGFNISRRPDSLPPSQ
ncbi:hypothetical protein L1987_64395 [Smallanthus sonchifolius]|uniref:Uncharacterized protein n=1 Tax=Smallanthus sonchifolius TaxID=185202 RepID=A0ACB9CFX8_9ASTR|nr:hypothetical protein L1987_64395 [Smallanthus sonchifolius]